MTNVPVLFARQDYPVFQNITFPSAEAARNATRVNISLIQDPVTGTVKNRDFDAQLMTYDENYHNEQGLSDAFKTHLLQVSELIAAYMPQHKLVEIGCGKGVFLDLLSQQGFSISGFDPSYVGDDSRIRKAYFNAQSNVACDGIILRHVLEHIEDPLSFLHLIKSQAPAGTKIYIEVPNLDWILAKNAWFDVFYEHVNYFRLSDFQRYFKRTLSLGDIFHQQYLYVIADLDELQDVASLPAEPARLAPFSLGLGSALLAQLQSEQPISIWGGASKGVIFALNLARMGLKVARIIDINPKKQGQYTAVTGIRIESPEEARQGMRDGESLYVMNSNYLEEIKTMTANRFTYHIIEDN